MDEPTPAVLVVEGTDTDGEIVERFRDDHGFEVHTADTIPEARSILETDPIECVVSGYEVADATGRRFRGGLVFLSSVRDRFPTMPFIIYTRIGNAELAEALIEADVTDYIVSSEAGDPIGRLRDRVEEAIERRRTQHRAEQHHRINEVLRDVNQAIVRAEDREGIESAVCEYLTTPETYRIALFGTIDDGVFHVSTGASSEPIAAFPPDELPVPSTVDLTDISLIDPAEDSSLAIGDVESTLVVPVAYDTHEYGTLILGATRRDAFDVTERAVLRELGETIAHALHAIEAHETLRKRERELERQNERLEHFAHVLSHDLRNPLQIATGTVELIEGNETARERLTTALSRMDELIDDVLALTRNTEASLDIEECDLGAVAYRAWATVDTADASLTVEDVGPIEADESYLGQLFENLFRNAVEHAGEDVQVRVEGTSSGFAVSDDGPGIPEADRDLVFEMGYSSDDSGTGFGLNIVEEIAQAHGWSARVTESASGGARFEFDFE